MTPREGGTAAAGHTKLQLRYNYTTVGPKRHQGHRRTHGGIERDTRRTGGHTGDARGTRGTGGRTRGDRSGPQGHRDPQGALAYYIQYLYSTYSFCILILILHGTGTGNSEPRRKWAFFPAIPGTLLYICAFLFSVLFCPCSKQ
jgi:hypothetical protein